MRVLWTILKYIFGAIALWLVIAVGVVAYDIISVRRDINHSSESFGIGDSIYEFWVPEGKLIWIDFSSGRNSAFCLKATLSRNELTVELPGKQTSCKHWRIVKTCPLRCGCTAIPSANAIRSA